MPINVLLCLLVSETKMTFRWNFHHWLHQKLTKRQLVQPVMNISLTWQHFNFNRIYYCSTVCGALSYHAAGSFSYCDGLWWNDRLQCSTEIRMSPIWRFSYHLPLWKLPFRQLLVSVMKISSKWQHFRFSDIRWFLSQTTDIICQVFSVYRRAVPLTLRFRFPLFHCRQNICCLSKYYISRCVQSSGNQSVVVGNQDHTIKSRSCWKYWWCDICMRPFYDGWSRGGAIE